MGPSSGIQLGAKMKEWAERDAQRVVGWRYFPRVVLESGAGVIVKDVEGHEYFDMTAGMMCMVLGHSHPELTKVLIDQAQRLVHTSSFYVARPVIEYAELIASTLPRTLEQVHFAVTGSEANEVALRVARAVTGKFDVVSVVRGLHGGTLVAESLTSIGGKRKLGLGPLLMPARLNAIVAPYCYRCPLKLTYPSCNMACVDLSEELIKHASTGEISAFIVEPMMVAGGMIVPPEGWLGRIREMAHKYGALLIVDEAQFAPAKTGRMWAFEHDGVVPDMVTFCKGMSAGMPISGVVTSRALSEQAAGNAGVPWGGTFSADPLAAAVAHRQLQIVLDDDFVARAEKLGRHLREALERLKAAHEVIGDVRGKGFYQMIEFVTDRESKSPAVDLTNRVRYNAVQEGVLFLSRANYLRICPPLVMTETQINEAMDRLDRAIRKALEGHPRNVERFDVTSLA